MHLIQLLSGGLDSTVLLAYLIDEHHDVETVSVNYGQRHVKEITAASQIAYYYGVGNRTLDLSQVGKMLAGSSLTDRTVEVPDGHYADDTMRATVVPNRNLLMLSAAAAFAVSQGADGVAYAVHAGDHTIYPDCRPEFVMAAATALYLGTLSFGPEGRGIKLLAPFVERDKASLVVLGHDLEVPFSKTWSCYKGGEVHCGTCGTCVERREAFDLAGVSDPTLYKDSWSDLEVADAARQ